MQTRKQILVVDSDDAIRVALDEEIKELGHDPVTTWSGIEALDLLKSGRFDLLLIDAYLPDMYIGDFLERVSLLPVRPQIWVMQSKPTQDMCSYGSRCFSVVGKRQVAQILESRGTDIGDDIPGPASWTN